MNAAVLAKCILVVGNIRSLHERLSHVRSLGFDVEWRNVDNDRRAPRLVRSLGERIARRSYDGVVILEGFVSHSLTLTIEDACRRAGVPYAYGGHGGRREIADAFAFVSGRFR